MNLLAALVTSNGGSLRLSPLAVHGRRAEVFEHYDPLQGDTIFSTTRAIPPDVLKGWRFIFRGGAE